MNTKNVAILRPPKTLVQLKKLRKVRNHAQRLVDACDRAEERLLNPNKFRD